MPKDARKRYQKKDPISHCLDRTDMYVGSTRLRLVDEYVAKEGENGCHIFQKSVKISPAILRIFIEALSNAIDNVERSRHTNTKCSKICVTIDKQSGRTTVWNDGDIVPIEYNDEEDCYIHTMIFGHLLTGSNYDDEEERLVSGRNGLGIKLTNIFSSELTVKGYDPNNGKTLEQTWTNNMRKTDGPEVKSVKGDSGYTEVSWIPDFHRFGLGGYTDDIVDLYTRYVIDAAMLTKVKVYLNEELIPVKTLADYASLYDTPTDEKLLIKTPNAEVFLTPATEFQAVSFVNGVYTRLGGQHVDAWGEELFRPIVDKFNGKDKKSKTKSPKVNISDVRQFFRLFVVESVVRPEFDGQDKNKLESPEIVASVKKTHISVLMKWSVMDNIEDIIRAKEMIVLKKAEKVSKKTKIEGYDSANKAGTKDSEMCSLFITGGVIGKNICRCWNQRRNLW